MPLPAFNCFGKAGLDDLQKIFNDRRKLEANKDLSDKDLARKIAQEEHKKLFDNLNDIRKKTKLPQEKYPTPSDNTEKIKSITEDYNKKIEQEKQNILSQSKQKEQSIKFRDILKDVDAKEIDKLKNNVTAVDMEKFLRNLEKQDKIKIEC